MEMNEYDPRLIEDIEVFIESLYGVLPRMVTPIAKENIISQIAELSTLVLMKELFFNIPKENFTVAESLIKDISACGPN